MILAGDIGGTKCNLALYEINGKSHRKIIKQRYESREFPAFDEIISKFLFDTRAETKDAGADAIEAAGFGVAGPVIDHRVKATNLPWIVDASALSAQLERRTLSCLTIWKPPLYSLALHGAIGAFHSQPRDATPQATQALLAAGTGLGEAILFWDGKQYVVAELRRRPHGLCAPD